MTLKKLIIGLFVFVIVAYFGIGFYVYGESTTASAWKSFVIAGVINPIIAPKEAPYKPIFEVGIFFSFCNQSIDAFTS